MPSTEETKSIQNGFRSLVGRTPTSSEVLDLIHIKDSLGLRSDDPLWMILYALQNYQTLYKAIPAEIHEAINRAESVFSRLDERKCYRFPWGGRSSWISALVVLGAFLVSGVLAYHAGSLTITEPVRRLAELNDGGQILATCFHGAGRIEKRQDGKTYCFAVSSEGKTFGYVVDSNH